MRALSATACLVVAMLAGCGGGGGSTNNDSSGTDAAPGPSQAHRQGLFGASFSWPIIPIHLVLLADGRVMNYGSMPDGKYGGMYYSVWDPGQGTGAASMLLLPNTTATNIFCGGQALLPATGEVLLVGGDGVVDGEPQYGIPDVNLYEPRSNALVRQGQSMAYPRWYATAVTNARGDQVVMGGWLGKYRDGGGADPSAGAAATPEIYSRATGWRTLTGATSSGAYGSTAQYDETWYYPRAWVAPDGRIFVLTPRGNMYFLDSSGVGTVRESGSRTVPSESTFPSVMYEPGKILSVRRGREAVLVDLQPDGPKVRFTDRLSTLRHYGNATLLADGRVWANGGSSTGNDLGGAAYRSELWSKDTGQWTAAAPAAHVRLYHSASLLLPDATVLTAGGGAPGPVANLNAEIYYPPYLFKPDGSGELAARPVIRTAPAALGWGQAFEVEIDAAVPISRVTLVRAGSVTHSFNNDQRFIELPYTQDGAAVRLAAPGSRNTAPPGYYLLFAFDAAGVPSTARMIRLLD